MYIIIWITCVFGNILVVLSYFSYKPLKSNQNIFLVSLAVADTLVALFVLPFHITIHFTGKWIFGTILCHFFLTFDIMLCTASCIHLCFIALDRYWSIKNSIRYSHQRTVRFVLVMIFVAWTLSVLISIPVTIMNTETVGSSGPNLNTSQSSNLSYQLLTENSFTLSQDNYVQCEIPRHVFYRIYSSFGTFFIPLLIMTFVYFQIYLETRKRFHERSKAVSKLAKSIAHSNRTDGKKSEEKKITFLSKCCAMCSKKKKIKESELIDHHNIQQKAEENALLQANSVGFISSAQNECVILSDISNMMPDLEQNSEKDSSQVPKKNSDSDQDDKNPKITVNKSDKMRSASNGITLSMRQKVALNRERKATRTLTLIMGSFIVCWFPFFVVYLLQSFMDINAKIFDYLTCLGYVNSALNPVIYTIFNLDFRKSFERILLQCIFLKRRN